MQDLLGQAIYDYAMEEEKGLLHIHNTYGDPDEMPVEVYFRETEDFFDVENEAIARCKGRVLDVGAGAGAHVLELQNQAFEVDALEISELASKVMYLREVKSIITGSVFDMPETEPYDTLLLMMNTIGLVGTLDKLSTLFKKLKNLIKPDGQILFDSSDVAYVYDDKLPTDHYYGEMDYQYEYAGVKGGWFKWLYVDFETAQKEAVKSGLRLEQLYINEETGQYLARGTYI